MRYRKLGSSDLQASVVAFGAWAIGGSWGEQRDEDSLAALHRAIDLGCNFIDTAAGYGNGRSEKLIGQVLRDRVAETGRVDGTALDGLTARRDAALQADWEHTVRVITAELAHS